MSFAKFSGLLITLSLVAGCVWPTAQITPSSSENSTNGTAETYWLDYALTQCNTAPWGKSTEPEIVTDYFSTNITVFAVEVTPPTAGMIFCQACGCPTGTIVSIQTNAAGQVYLLEQGFTAAGTALESSTITNTNVTPATSTTSTTNAQISNTAVEEPAVDIVEIQLSESDANLRDRAEQVEAALTNYYIKAGSYPEDISALQLTVDFTGITYTPIGSLPASYYDLAVAYTTGAKIINP